MVHQHDRNRCHRIYKLDGSVDWFQVHQAMRGKPEDRQIADKRAQYFSFSQPVQAVGGPRWVRAISIPLSRNRLAGFEYPMGTSRAIDRICPQVKASSGHSGGEG